MFQTYTRLTIRLFILLISCTSYQQVNATNLAANQSHTSYRQEEPWYLHPFTVQLNQHLGVVMPIELLDAATQQLGSKFLFALGGRTDVSLLYPTKWLWKHFDCYPKVGLILKYDYITANNIDEKGHIVGSVFYIEPNYNHLSGWEILPRFGVGIAYLKMPGAFSSVKPQKKINEDGEEEETSITVPDVDPFRQGPSLDLIFDILVKYRLTPKWHLNFSLGVDYLPQLTADNSEEDTVTPSKKKTIEIYTASLGCSYTFNPSSYNPDRVLTTDKRRGRIDVAFFNSFRKLQLSTSLTRSGDNSENEVTKDNKYYYLKGLHIQWSFRFFNNQALVLGTEWMKDSAHKKEIEKSVKKEDLQVSFMAGHEFIWGKLIFGQYAGIYTLNNALIPEKNAPLVNFGNLFYIRLGLNYRITDYLYIGTNLKTSLLPPSPIKNPIAINYTRIEYLDFRIGYTF